MDIKERRESVLARSAKRIGNVINKLWNGENRINGKVQVEQVANKEDVAKFDAVIRGIHERQESYAAGMRTNGNLGEAQRRNRERAAKQQNVSIDRAD